MRPSLRLAEPAGVPPADPTFSQRTARLEIGWGAAGGGHVHVTA